eukprot:6204230-Pleurochrysis_carterae.AAC.1
MPCDAAGRTAARAATAAAPAAAAAAAAVELFRMVLCQDALNGVERLGPLGSIRGVGNARGACTMCTCPRRSMSIKQLRAVFILRPLTEFLLADDLTTLRAA